jgi:squalene monooxygenase
MDESDVLIVGGGFAGLAMGAALAPDGHSVRILDGRDGPMKTFRGELLHPRAVRALDGLGLRDGLVRSGAEVVTGFVAFDGAESEPVSLPYGSEYGDGLGLEHAEMTQSFREKLDSCDGVEVLKRARVEGILRERDRVSGVRCADGREYRARLVIAADGRHSRVREMLGVPVSSTLLSYTVAPSFDGAALPRANHGHVFVGAPGPILAYPFGRARGRMCIDVPFGAASKREGLVGFIRENYARFVPEPLRGAMIRSLGEGSLGGSANHEIATRACAVPGAALVGDAAGCSHPLTATGMTTALHDVVTLAACLREIGLTDRALVAYQKRRYGFVRAREVFAHALYEVCRQAGPGPRALCEGMFLYWRGSARARRTSMGILAGDQSSAMGFFAEYTRVVGLSGAHALATAMRAGKVAGAAKPLGALVTTAAGCYDLAMGKAFATLTLKGRRRLSPLPSR